MKKSNSLLLAALLAATTALSSTGAPLSRVQSRLLAGSAYEPVQPATGKTSVLPKMKTASTLPVTGIRRVLSPTDLKRNLALRSATSASRSIAEDVDLRGCVLYPNSMLGFYTLPKTDGGEFIPYGTTDLVAVINGGGYDDGEGLYHGVFYQTSSSGNIAVATVYHLDSRSLDIVSTTDLADGSLIADDVAMDPVTGEVYGCYLTEEGRCWGKGDYQAGTRREIRQLQQHEWLAGVGCDDKGQFYGVTIMGDFVRIDKQTGEYQTVSQAGVPYEYMAGGCVDTTHGKFLVSYNTSAAGGGIYEIDLSTGTASRAVDFQKDVVAVGLYVGAAPVDEKTPAAPSLTVSAPQGSMNVSYSIEMPATLRDGTPVKGSLDYALWVDGEVKAEGSADAGTTVSGELPLSKAGMTDFVAQVSNAAGKSPRAHQSLFVGNGLPSMPQNVVASWADGRMKITWDAVTGSADGGYIDPAAVTYSVFNGSTLVARNISATEYQFAFPTPEERSSYTFFVSASYDGKVSGMGTSNVIWVGAYPVPFETVFNSKTIFNDLGYTILDGNGDGHQWTIRGLNNGAMLSSGETTPCDDWMITPSLKFEAGKVYPFSMIVHAESDRYVERVEVKAGQGLTAADMSQTVIPPTEVTALVDAPATLSGFIVPSATGEWNVGVHGISDPMTFWLTVVSLEISEGVDASAPDAVTELRLVPDPSGLPALSGSFRLPTLDVAGRQLSGTVSVEVKCGDRIVGNLSGAVGSVVNFADNLPGKGTYKYTVTTSVGQTRGVPVSSSVFVGPYPAAAPVSASVCESNEDGRVTVSWEPVAADVNGNPIDPANVSYMVYTIEVDENLFKHLTPIADENFTGEFASFMALEDVSKQSLVQYAVKAFNRDAESEEFATTNMIPVGKGYDMPIVYSGSAEIKYQLLSMSSQGRGFWDIYSPENLEDAPEPVASFDYFGCYAGSAEAYGDLSTGKIDLTSALHPELSYYTYCLNDGDKNFVEAFVIADGETTRLGRALHEEMKVGKWTKVRYDLSAYRGKNIQVMIRAVAKTQAYTFVDEITVKETPDKDLAAVGISAPAEVKTGEKFNISVTVANYGYENAGAFDVNLYRDGDIVATRNVASLDVDAEISVDFEEVLSLFDAGNEASYSAEVLLDGDKDSSNDATVEITVSRPVSALPAVKDLSGERTAGGNKLTWTPYGPEELEGVEMTEDFENATPWTGGFGGWTFLDVDQKPVSTAGIFSIKFPNIVSGVTTSSFFVYNRQESAPGNNSMAGNSGEQYLVALYNADRQTNDDWAISPRLTGNAQTISFYAKSFRASSPESIEVLYTTEDSLDPDDYEMIDSEEAIPDEWTRYEVELPAGALHFAIRYVSTDTYFVMIDDVTFTPDPYLSLPTLIGYDVYRDGVKINEAPVTTGEYLDTDADGSAHTYHVVAKFAEGESEASNAVVISQSGIDAVSVANLKIAVDGHDIVVTGAADAMVSIVAVDGRVLHRACGDLRLTVTPAVYIISVANRAVKVIVK